MMCEKRLEILFYGAFKKANVVTWTVQVLFCISCMRCVCNADSWLEDNCALHHERRHRKKRGTEQSLASVDLWLKGHTHPCLLMLASLQLTYIKIFCVFKSVSLKCSCNSSHRKQGEHFFAFCLNTPLACTINADFLSPITQQTGFSYQYLSN